MDIQKVRARVLHDMAEECLSNPLVESRIAQYIDLISTLPDVKNGKIAEFMLALEIITMKLLLEAEDAVTTTNLSELPAQPGERIN